jgi:hypothetical protein
MPGNEFVSEEWENGGKVVLIVGQYRTKPIVAVELRSRLWWMNLWTRFAKWKKFQKTE